MGAHVDLDTDEGFGFLKLIAICKTFIFRTETKEDN